MTAFENAIGGREVEWPDHWELLVWMWKPLDGQVPLQAQSGNSGLLDMSHIVQSDTLLLEVRMEGFARR